MTDVKISIDPKVCTSRPTNEVQLSKWINDYYPKTSKSGIADCNKAYCDQVSEYLSTDECDPNQYPNVGTKNANDIDYCECFDDENKLIILSNACSVIVTASEPYGMTSVQDCVDNACESPNKDTYPGKDRCDDSWSPVRLIIGLSFFCVCCCIPIALFLCLDLICCIPCNLILLIVLVSLSASNKE